MKISDKEKILLVIVGTLLISVLYFQFIFLKQRNDIADLERQRDDVKNQYSTTMDLINSIGDKQLKVVNLSGEINDKSKTLYPAIIQEKIILELDKVIREANVEANLTFSEISTRKIEYATPKEREQKENILETYKAQFKGEDDSSKAKGSSEESTNLDSSSDLNTEQIKVTMSYEGTYSQLTDFIKKIELHNQDKKIMMTNLTGALNTSSGKLKGTFDLNFYSIPKIDDSDNGYFKYTLSDVIGKVNPFDVVVPAANSSQNQSSNPSSSENQVNEKSDFYIVARPAKSDLAKLSIRYALDTTMQSSVYSNNDGIEEAEIVLTEENGKYYFKYRTSSSSYPKNYEKEKVEFRLQGNEIVFLAMSALRIDENDKSGANIKIYNYTKKDITLYSKDDDPKRPRINFVNGITGEKVVLTQRN